MVGMLYMLHVSGVIEHVIHVTKKPSAFLWHRQWLGHITKKGMETLAHFWYVLGLDLSNFQFCELYSENRAVTFACCAWPHPRTL